MAGQRFRIITAQEEAEHVSASVFSADEIEEHLSFEAELHAAAGWKVTHVVENDVHIVVASKPGRRRKLFARAYDPMNDKGGEQP